MVVDEPAYHRLINPPGRICFRISRPTIARTLFSTWRPIFCASSLFCAGVPALPCTLTVIGVFTIGCGAGPETAAGALGRLTVTGMVLQWR
jgi:hypothetical protein